MNPLQYLVLRVAPGFVARTLAQRIADLSADEAGLGRSLAAAVAEAQAAFLRAPGHYRLAFELGRACERVASQAPWDARGPWIEQALGYYQTALSLAETGRVAGASAVPETGPEHWQPGLSLSDRARLAAALRIGLILVAEFRVRDPCAAISQLSRVVPNLSGYHPAWYYLGEAYLLNEQFTEAEQIWTRALALAPGDPTLLAVLRNLPADRVHHAAKLGDWQRVLAEIQRLPEGALPASERWTLEGDARLALGDESAARQCWLKALEADHVAIGVRKRLRKRRRPVL